MIVLLHEFMALAMQECVLQVTIDHEFVHEEKTALFVSEENPTVANLSVERWSMKAKKSSFWNSSSLCWREVEMGSMSLTMTRVFDKRVLQMMVDFRNGGSTWMPS